MSNESRTMSHEELIASNTALKAQVEYLAKEVAKLTKIKLNELQGSDREEDVSSSGTMKPKATEGSDFKVDIPTFEGKNDPDEFLEWLETVERVFDFEDVSDEKKVKIVALKFRKYASTWWTNTCTKRRRNDKELVSTWAKMRSLLKKKFLPAEYVRENFAKLQTLRQVKEETNMDAGDLLHKLGKKRKQGAPILGSKQPSLGREEPSTSNQVVVANQEVEGSSVEPERSAHTFLKTKETVAASPSTKERPKGGPLEKPSSPACPPPTSTINFKTRIKTVQLHIPPNKSLKGFLELIELSPWTTVHQLSLEKEKELFAIENRNSERLPTTMPTNISKKANET
ncbi:unnamed protein product [Cuscuta campestris]|uniref:Retrotransposon gag domain-containing protein n=1 Tax=Cuscuta campestris TaxID=132261 RepID=A0A484M4X8_9ASTE|nr:unnamed protein product [Cuscuta campestris]